MDGYGSPSGAGGAREIQMEGWMVGWGEVQGEGQADVLSALNMLDERSRGAAAQD